MARAAGGEGDHPPCTERSEGRVGIPRQPGAQRRTLVIAGGWPPVALSPEGRAEHYHFNKLCYSYLASTLNVSMEAVQII